MTTNVTTNEKQLQHPVAGHLDSDSVGNHIPTGFFFDEKEHAYFLDGKPLHGITSVLGVISKPALIGWAANQVVEYIKTTCSWSEEYSAWLVSEANLGQAKIAHRKKKEDAAEKGTDLHALVEEYVGYCISFGGKATAESVDKWEPIKQFTNWAATNNIRFLASEQRLYSKEFWTAGTCDLVFEKDGKTYIGDVKTYKKIWDRTPFFQCAAYGMMWEEMGMALMKEDLKPRKIDGYCVLRLSKDGTFEDMWSFDVKGDREAFKCALGLYKALKAFKA